MSSFNRVVWNEGLFLQPQHFQQQDRFVEGLVHGVVSTVASYPWGVTGLSLNAELLKLGKIAIASAVGVTPDGVPFRIPEEEEHPPALDVPEEIKNCIVYLALPVRQPGAREVDLTEDAESVARYKASETEVRDAVGGGAKPVTVGVGKMRLRFALEVDELADTVTIPIARIIEVQSDKQIVLDRSFIPSCLDITAAPALENFVGEVEGLLSHRAEALAGRLSDSGPSKGVAEIGDFLLLMAVNRYLPQITHLRTIENVHPSAIYQLCVAIAGELSTLMAAEKRPPEFPPYRHGDLTQTFQPVMRVLRQYLSAVLEQTAISIPLEARKYGVSVAVVADKRLLSTASFVIAAKADIAIESVRRHFPTQAKIGPVEKIRDLVNSALPGIGLRPLPVAPRQIPYHAGVVYFELDRDSPFWKQMTASGGVAVHVSGDFPGLDMELWAIRDA